MYFTTMVLNVIILKFLNYVTITILTLNPWSLFFFFLIKKKSYQTNLMSLTIVGFFLSFI